MSGHPIPISGPRVGAARAQARGAEPVSQSAGVGSLAQLVTDARLTGALLLSILQRPVDWSALPPTGPEAVTAAELQLMCARADVRSALYAITALDDLTRRVPGPTDSRLTPGKEPSPGSAAALGRAACESASAVVAARAGTSSDPRPRLSQRAPTGNGVRPRVGLTTGAASMGASFTLPAAPRFAVGESMARHW